MISAVQGLLSILWSNSNRQSHINPHLVEWNTSIRVGRVRPGKKKNTARLFTYLFFLLGQTVDKDKER